MLTAERCPGRQYSGFMLPLCAPWPMCAPGTVRARSMSMRPLRGNSWIDFGSITSPRLASVVRRFSILPAVLIENYTFLHAALCTALEIGILQVGVTMRV